MRWIGQHIVSLIARFRSDVYLEDISTGTIADGSNLGLDAAGKIVKADVLEGDLTSIIAGTGLGGTNLTGPIPTLNVDASIPEITTLEGLTSLGAASATTNIVAGDVTVYNAVNNGNPTISLGSSAANRLEIKSTYNSGSQTLCDIDFTTYTSSSSGNDGRYSFFVDEVLVALLNDDNLIVTGGVISQDAEARFAALNTTASASDQGGKVQMFSDDGAAMGDDHRLGVIEFYGAEDASNTRSIGARIQAICRDAWDSDNNDTDLEFYTTDETTESKVLTLDADKLATFTGAVTVTGALTGTLATASQTNITGVGTIDTGVWNGTAIASAYLDADTAHLSGAQTFTGTKTLNSFKGTAGSTVTNILDEDAMGSDSATALATQQSIKAYADTKVASAAQTQLTHHNFSDDIDTAKHYLGFTGGDTESEATGGSSIPIIAPFAGKLLKVFLRSNKNLQTLTFTWRLETQAGVNFGTGPSVVGTQSGAGCRNTTMTTYDFTSSLDSGDNLIDAGDAVYLSIQSDGSTASTKFFITCLWEWNLS